MAFDYCTAAEVFAYGNSAGQSTDPVNESAFMATKIIPSLSRMIDNYCEQAFSLATYTDKILKGVVDADGVLTCYPSVPTMTTPTATEYRYGNLANWLSLSGADVIEQNHGCIVRFLGGSLLAIRGKRIQVRMSYEGGYADLASLPEDLRGAARGLAWYEFQRRSAPMDQSAIPELGVVIIPGNWPANYRRVLDDYRKVIAQ